MSPSIVRSTLLCAASALILTGCYRYRPIPIETAPPGENVQVTVTPAGAFELGEVTNVSRAVPNIRGEFMGREGDVLLLQVPVGSRQDGIHRVDLQQIIRVPSSEVLGMSRRELDGKATGLLVGAGAAGVGVLLFGIIDAFGTGNSNGDGGGPDDTLLPLRLFSIPIG